MFKPAKYQTKLLKGIEDKGIIIYYEKGSAGNLLHRIIAASSSSVYWSKFINKSNSYIKDDKPLEWSKEEFITCHTGHFFIEESHMSRVLDRRHRDSEVIKAIKQNKIIVLQTHVDIRCLNKNIKVLRIVGDEARLRRKGIARTGRHFLQPIVEDNTYNLNINNLVDKNYDIFKKEYLNLCSNYNFTSDVKAIRDFILLWRSKQTFINDELTNEDALAFKLYWTKS